MLGKNYREILYLIMKNKVSSKVKGKLGKNLKQKIKDKISIINTNMIIIGIAIIPLIRNKPKLITKLITKIITKIIVGPWIIK